MSSSSKQAADIIGFDVMELDTLMRLSLINKYLQMETIVQYSHFVSYRHIHHKLADAFLASLRSYVYLQLTVNVRDSMTVDGQHRKVDTLELFVSGDECWIHGFQTIVEDGEWTRQWRGTIEDEQVTTFIRRYARLWTMALHQQNVEREQARHHYE